MTDKTVIKKTTGDKTIFCFNPIHETSAFMITTDEDQFFAEDFDLDLSLFKNRNWQSIADHILKKYGKRHEIEEIVSC
jgi:hypothetical protein|tara:strand:+ start:292 stop:525 length:234 start_codon:yes stop_codon:yes gene_type:complete